MAAEVLSEAMPSHQYFGGMAANQTTFDGQQFRNQVAYAFKNRSMFQPMPQQFQQQMGMAPYMCAPQMYGGMAQMGQMGMVNMGAANFDCDDNKNNKKQLKNLLLT